MLSNICFVGSYKYKYMHAVSIIQDNRTVVYYDTKCVFSKNLLLLEMLKKSVSSMVLNCSYLLHETR